jgi:hypothetical protein
MRLLPSHGFVVPSFPSLFQEEVSPARERVNPQTAPRVRALAGMYKSESKK